MKQKIKIKAEDLAHWYLRLNGFLTTTNFIIHSIRRGQTKTEIDIIGIRFPNRIELFDHNDPISDDSLFKKIEKPHITICEVTTSRCKINDSIRKKQDNLEDVLRTFGFFCTDKIKTVATDLQNQGKFENENYYVTFLLFGNQSDEDLKKSLPGAIQTNWRDVLTFIYNRFKKYRRIKTAHSTWKSPGKNLYDKAISSNEITTGLSSPR